MTGKRDSALVTNRKAFRDFEILDRFEAGIVLQGTEVKSLRAHRANLSDSFARVMKAEMWLMNMHISPWEFGNIHNHEATRTRKLLMHKKEIQKLAGMVSVKGKSLIPLKLYLKKGIVKVQLGLAKGRQDVDKRQVLRRKATDREIQKALRLRQKR